MLEVVPPVSRTCGGKKDVAKCQHVNGIVSFFWKQRNIGHWQLKRTVGNSLQISRFIVIQLQIGAFGQKEAVSLPFDDRTALLYSIPKTLLLLKCLFNCSNYPFYQRIPIQPVTCFDLFLDRCQCGSRKMSFTVFESPWAATLTMFCSGGTLWLLVGNLRLSSINMAEQGCSLTEHEVQHKWNFSPKNHSLETKFHQYLCKLSQ